MNVDLILGSTQRFKLLSRVYVSYYKGKTHKAAANHHHSIVIYMLMYYPAEMKGPWSGIAIVGYEPATCQSVF